MNPSPSLRQLSFIAARGGRAGRKGPCPPAALSLSLAQIVFVTEPQNETGCRKGRGQKKDGTIWSPLATVKTTATRYDERSLSRIAADNRTKKARATFVSREYSTSLSRRIPHGSKLGGDVAVGLGRYVVLRGHVRSTRVRVCSSTFLPIILLCILVKSSFKVRTTDFNAKIYSRI